MRKMRTVLYLSIVMLVTSACHPQSVLEVDFVTPDSGRAILYNTKASKTDTLDFSGGSFHFEDHQLKSPTLFYMIIDGYNNSRPMSLVLSGEKTHIKFDTLKRVRKSNKIAETYPNQPRLIKDPNNNQVFFQFHKAWMVFYDSIVSLPSPDTKKGFEERSALYQSFLHSCDSLIQSNRNEFIAAIVIDYLVRDGLLQLNTIQTYYDYLTQNVKDSYFGLRIGEYAGKGGKLQPGNPAPAFVLTDINDEKYNLSQLKGRKVLLHFWSSTCAPCIKEAPDLIDLSREHQHTLTTINVSLDTDRNKWLKGIKRAGIDEMNNVCDLSGYQGNIVKDYAINVIPAYYLIDEQGKILMKGSLNQVSEELKKSAR